MRLPERNRRMDAGFGSHVLMDISRQELLITGLSHFFDRRGLIACLVQTRCFFLLVPFDGLFSGRSFNDRTDAKAVRFFPEEIRV